MHLYHLLSFTHEEQESPRFDSLVKFDLETGAVASKYTMPPKRLLVAEPMFVPKIGKGNPATVIDVAGCVI